MLVWRSTRLPAALVMLSAMFLHAAEVEITPMPAGEKAELVAPWIAPGDTAWREGKESFRIGDDGADPSARGWVAASEQGVHVRVLVRDAQHVNTRTDGAIWDGDALQTGFDAIAAGVGARESHEAFVGPTVSAMAFALTPTGPQAWAYYHGRQGGADGRPDLAPAVTRDEESQLTTYDLLFPWADYGIQPGVAETFGLTIQVNDSDPEVPQKRISFGGGASGPPRPGMFRRIAVAAPTSPVAGVSFIRPSLWREGDRIVATLATFGHEQVKTRVTVGDASPQLLDLPAGSGRHMLRATLGELPSAPVPVRIELLAGEKVIASASADVDAPGRFMAQLDRKLGEMASAASHPLVARHFASVRAIFAQEWNKATLYTESNPEMAAECVQYATKALKTLNDLPGEFADQRYLNGERGMVFTFIADDSTLQWYHLALPRGYQAKEPSPAVVYLHGSGNPHPLNSVSGVFEPLAGPDAAWDQPVVRIAPWARGNYGYHDIAEADVMKSFADAKCAVKIDEDRTYLMGHSLGGGGTWALALRHPDTWAAAAVASGVTWFLPTGQGYGMNATSLPMLIWHGEADGSAANVSEAYAMQKELEAHGNKPEMRIVPGRGHDFAPPDHSAVLKWLLQHERQRPARFSYKMATGAPRGVWGVTMRSPRNGAPNPSFACEVEGSHVKITSEEVSRFSLRLGEGGLGLKGEVKVSLNGVEVYSGPATDVEIPGRDR